MHNSILNEVFLKSDLMYQILDQLSLVDMYVLLRCCRKINQVVTFYPYFVMCKTGYNFDVHIPIVGKTPRNILIVCKILTHLLIRTREPMKNFERFIAQLSVAYHRYAPELFVSVCKNGGTIGTIEYLYFRNNGEKTKEIFIGIINSVEKNFTDICIYGDHKVIEIIASHLDTDQIDIVQYFKNVCKKCMNADTIQLLIILFGGSPHINRCILEGHKSAVGTGNIIISEYLESMYDCVVDKVPKNKYAGCFIPAVNCLTT